jgi:hypothetical protein
MVSDKSGPKKKKKDGKIPSQWKKVGMVPHACHLNFMAGNVKRKIIIQASLGKKQDPISKITREKRVAGMAQTVQHVLSKYETLISNLTITKQQQQNRILESGRPNFAT